MTPKVFRKEESIPNIEDLLTELKAGNWVYLHKVPKHPSIILNMTLGTVRGFLHKGLISYAIRRQPNAYQRSPKEKDYRLSPS